MCVLCVVCVCVCVGVCICVCVGKCVYLCVCVCVFVCCSAAPSPPIVLVLARIRLSVETFAWFAVHCCLDHTLVDAPVFQHLLSQKSTSYVVMEICSPSVPFLLRCT